MTPDDLEARVSYLEGKVADLTTNIVALNESMTTTARAMKQMLNMTKQESENMSGVLTDVLARVCPFPPECSS